MDTRPGLGAGQSSGRGGRHCRRYRLARWVSQTAAGRHRVGAGGLPGPDRLGRGGISPPAVWASRWGTVAGRHHHHLRQRGRRHPRSTHVVGVGPGHQSPNPAGSFGRRPSGIRPVRHPEPGRNRQLRRRPGRSRFHARLRARMAEGGVTFLGGLIVAAGLVPGTPASQAAPTTAPASVVWIDKR